MQQAPGIQGARQYWYQKNNYHIAFEMCQNLEPVYNYDAHFGLQGLWDAGNNATRQFVGSYKVDIIPNGDGNATFHAHNITSMTSFLYDLGPSWSRETFPPGGNQVQDYTWIEPVCNPS
jgi:hypothetical protein